MFKNKYNKALTFSFDDGVIYDKRLVALLNKYNLKATFNLNSGKLSRAYNWIEKNTMVFCMNLNEIGNLYDGHEIASHSLSHPYLPKLDYETQYNEIEMDMKNIKNYFNRDVVGFALPYGNYDDNTMKVLEELGIKYNRLCGQTMKFDVSENLLKYNGTCHFKNPKIYELADQFLSYNGDKEQVFYIWGHSYELETDDSWDQFEQFLKYISNKDDIYYCTNQEAFHLD